MMQLITAGERPASVWFNGYELRIDVHDAFYIRTCRHLLALMASTHPDRGENKNHKRLTGHTFLKAGTSLRSFRATESVWYGKRGLKPPRTPVGALHANPTNKVFTGSCLSQRDFYRAYHLPVHTKAARA